jgi:hypothetical protein
LRGGARRAVGFYTQFLNYSSTTSTFGHSSFKGGDFLGSEKY